jgi:hypothetical protein
MNPRVIKVKPAINFQLNLTFSNGEEKVLDMNPYLNMGRFIELKNEAMFASVICSMGSIQWQNGLDLCPDTLYEESIPYKKVKTRRKVDRRDKRLE